MSAARILVADDDPGARALLASILRAAGFSEIVQVADGQSALAQLRETAPFALAFLDIAMPVFTGIEVLTMAKLCQPACRWVLVSGHSALDNVLAGLNAGASSFVVKPYAMVKIHDALTRCGMQGRY